MEWFWVVPLAVLAWVGGMVVGFILNAHASSQHYTKLLAKARKEAGDAARAEAQRERLDRVAYIGQVRVAGASGVHRGLLAQDLTVCTDHRYIIRDGAPFNIIKETYFEILNEENDTFLCYLYEDRCECKACNKHLDTSGALAWFTRLDIEQDSTPTAMLDREGRRIALEAYRRTLAGLTFEGRPVPELEAPKAQGGPSV